MKTGRVAAERAAKQLARTGQKGIGAKDLIYTAILDFVYYSLDVWTILQKYDFLDKIGFMDLWQYIVASTAQLDENTLKEIANDYFAYQYGMENVVLKNGEIPGWNNKEWEVIWEQWKSKSENDSEH